MKVLHGKYFLLWSQNYWQKMWNEAMKLKVSSISEEIVLSLRTCRKLHQERFLELEEIMTHTNLSVVWIEVPTHLNAYASIHIFITLFTCISTCFQLCICVLKCTQEPCITLSMFLLIYIYISHQPVK